MLPALARRHARQRRRVSSLVDCCVRVIIAHIDGLGAVGDVPPDLMLPILRACTAEQLLALEELNEVRVCAAVRVLRVLCR